jgi:CBS domain containing-hemolysin-like protein
VIPDHFFLVAIVSILASMLSASAALSFHRLAVHELEELCERRNRTKWFDIIIETREWLTAGAETMRVLFTVVAISAAVTWLMRSAEIGEWELGPWFTMVLLLALAVLVFNSWMPLAIAEVAGAAFVFYSWRIFWVASVLAWPAIVASNFFGEILKRAAGMDDDEDGEEEWLEDEIRSMVSGGEREGLLESGERDMIEGVMELDEKDVFSVMTPRSKVDALDCEIDYKTAVEFVVSSGRTRIPIYRERLDNIVGILYAKDLLRESLKEESSRKNLVDIVRPALTVPESILLNEMLQRFLREQIHMAIVVDEYGAFSGIVTIEDILEEIVGEIVDETDRESHVPVVTMVNGVAQINGSARVDEVNEELGTEIPEDDEFDTVAGWIMARTKQVPRPGTNLVADDLQIRILRGTRRVIDQIELRVASKDANPNESGIAKS